MRFEFKQGVPMVTINWLVENLPTEKWEVIRETVDYGGSDKWYTPVVYVYDEQFAILFALAWLSEK